MKERENDIPQSVLECGGVIGRTRQTLIENAGKTIAAITGAVVALVTFTEIGFYDFRTTEFISSALLILIASYIIYFSLEDAGERLGRGSAVYREEEGRYRAVVTLLRDSGVEGLREFLERYSREELEYRRRGCLFRLGYTEDELARYLSGERFGGRKDRQLRYVARLKAVGISPSKLLSVERVRRSSELESPERGRIGRLLLGLIPSSLCMLFTFSVMLGARDGMTPEFVIESVLKLSGLPIIALRGYTVGYSLATGEGVGWLTTRTAIIEEFLKERGILPRHEKTEEQAQ